MLLLSLFVSVAMAKEPTYPESTWGVKPPPVTKEQVIRENPELEKYIEAGLELDSDPGCVDEDERKPEPKIEEKD